MPGVRARVAPGRNLGQPAEVMGQAFRMTGALLGRPMWVRRINVPSGCAALRAVNAARAGMAATRRESQRRDCHGKPSDDLPSPCPLLTRRYTNSRSS